MYTARLNTKDPLFYHILIIQFSGQPREAWVPSHKVILFPVSGGTKDKST
jgi:hypothetical protein